MKLEYNPRNVLRLVPSPLLHQYFEKRGALRELQWNELAGNVEPVYGAWMALPAVERQAVSVDFQNAFGLASKRGMKTLIDAGCSKGVNLIPLIGKGRASVENVFRVLLDHPGVFQIASYFTWADNLKRHWYRRHDLPKVAPDLSEGTRQELRQAISIYYDKNEGRGEYCEIEVYQRGDAHYFMVYLADYPSAVVCFENSNQLKRSLQQ